MYRELHNVPLHYVIHSRELSNAYMHYVRPFWDYIMPQQAQYMYAAAEYIYA